MRYFLIILLCCTCGCEQPKIQFTEVKRIDERITRADVLKFLAVTSIITPKKMPTLPPLFTPLPEWEAERTLAIQALLQEERSKQEILWDEKRIAQQLKDDRYLLRVLENHQLTLEQFIGLAHVIRIAIVKGNIDNQDELKAIWRVGQEKISKLEADTRTYSSLPDEAQYTIKQQAGWLNRMERCDQLQKVPFENVTLVAAFADQLQKLFPADYQMRPLDEIQDRIEVYGLPFEEMPASGYDRDLSWTPKATRARIGRSTEDRNIVQHQQP